jgi:hypothetical protein
MVTLRGTGSRHSRQGNVDTNAPRADNCRTGGPP